MKTKEKLLLVASFLEGKNFPKKTKTQFVVEAKFDGEQLTTDPVDHNENLEINQELAWELDKKALQQHKLNRSVIKCTCYTVGNDLKKENVGYFVLDVRTTPEGENKAKWYQLLQSKYGKMKPEIRINLYIEGEQSNKESAPTQEIKKDAKIVKVDSPYKGGNQIDPRKLKPILVESEGYFLIGPESHKSETFVLSVTIGFAKNLLKLIPSDFNLTQKGSFFFSYSLMGNQIISDTFKDILASDIAAERASVRLHTTFDILKVFMSNQKPIEIFFCAEEDILLGKANLNIKELLVINEKTLNLKPLVVDEILTIDSLKKVDNSDPRSIMGIQLTLRKENILLGSDTNDESKIQMNRTPSVSPIRQSNNAQYDQRTPSPKQRVQFKVDNELDKARSRSSSIESEKIEINKSNNNNHSDSSSSAKTFDIQTSSNENRMVYVEQPQYANNQISKSEISEEMQLKVAYELQVWKEAKEREFEAYVNLLRLVIVLKGILN